MSTIGGIRKTWASYVLREALVRDLGVRGPASADELAVRNGVGVSEVRAALARELAGRVREVAGRWELT